MAPKKKQEKMNLGAFLTDQSLGSWADEMDSQPLPPAPSGYSSRDRGDRDGGEKRAFTQPTWERSSSGMGGGMGGRGASYDRPQYAVREQLPLPDKPPYTAHLGNLAYDVSQADIEGFLEGCQVTSVRIVEDKVDRKPKGFGYVEFGTLDGLKTALTKSETNFMGRNIKISVAEPPKDRAESTRDFSDWSRKGPLPELPQNTRQPSNRGFSRNFDDARSDAGSERGGSRRPGFFENDGKVRDFGNWERKGPLSPVPTAGPPVREGGRLREAGDPRDRSTGPSWGEGRSDAGSRPPRPAPERVPTAAEQDNQWRSKMRPDPSPVPTPDASAPTSPSAKDAPKERPRLNLAKRTVSEAPTDAAAAASDSKASPFGAAKPVDSAARERAVEEKRQLTIRQKQEEDAKAREEKTKQDAEARAARAERADRGQAEEEQVGSPTGRAPPTGPRDGPPRPSRQQQNGPRGAKENGEAAQKERPKFTVLSRDGEDAAAQEEAEGAADAPDAPANRTIIGDKETKPQEIVQEKNAGEGAAVESTAEAMEDEGWSTVGAKTKSSRRGGQRALAS